MITGKFEITEAHNLLSQSIQEPEAFLGPWLRRGELFMLYSPRGVGKTRIAFKMAHSLSSGGSFLGQSPGKPRRVAYFDGEMGMRQVHGILTATEMGTSDSVPKEYLRVFPCDIFEGLEAPDLASKSGQAMYDKLSAGADVIIIDNLLTCTRLSGPRDNDFDQWGRVQPWLVKKRSQGVSVVLVHHAGKSGDQLGTSRREVMLDTVAKLMPSRLKDWKDTEVTAINWEWTKTRGFYGKDAEPLYIEHRTTDGVHTWHYSSLYEKKKQRFEELYYQDFPTQKIIDILNLSRGEAHLLERDIKTTELRPQKGDLF